VIPTVIVLGLIVGRWWFIPVAGLAWLALILGIDGELLPWAFVVGAGNAAAGVVVHQGIRACWRAVRPVEPFPWPPRT
jgi:hypothetical protein